MKPGDYLDVFEIIDSKTDEVVKRIDVSKKSQRHRGKVADGLVQKVDFDRYYTRLVYDGDGEAPKRKKSKPRALKVFGWQGWEKLSTFEQRDGRRQVRCICAASSRREVAELVGEKGPWNLFNLSETGNEAEVAFAMEHPRQVFAHPLDAIGEARKRWEPMKSRKS